MAIDDRQRDERRGMFISFEGGDGAGKSTHLQLVAEALRMRGHEVVCLREPGGTIIGEQLRQTVLDPGNYIMTDECELLIYEAARAQLVAQVIQPALERGATVLCDRFAHSTLAYQAAGRGLDEGFVRQANDFACRGVWPDRTILMMTGGDAGVGLQRAMHHKNADRLELAGLDFHERVNAAFYAMAEEDERVRLVVSDDPKAATARKVFAELSDLFPWMADETVCTDAFFDALVLARETMGLG
jgi:dTMP kinase